MTKPMREKVPVPMRHGHNRENTGPGCFLKVTRSRSLVIFSLYCQNLRHREESLLLLNAL